MYVCTYVCVCVFASPMRKMYVCTFACAQSMYVHMYSRICVCIISVCMFVCMYVCMLWKHAQQGCLFVVLKPNFFENDFLEARISQVLLLFWIVFESGFLIIIFTYMRVNVLIGMRKKIDFIVGMSEFHFKHLTFFCFFFAERFRSCLSSKPYLTGMYVHVHVCMYV
jgi:hypothetical protein